ncbi:Sna2 protein [Starmerella bacillaris]|uniref:Sna2 protein n=1 Tax=Starmerella bacillaris TaxID=1247836 RepID=A0AAV5RNI4_STABA|nr:Sna2 protein [Starmerella bacillaris]
MTSRDRNACTDILLILISIFLAPLAVAIRRGVCTADFIINIALCCLGYIPGVVHAWYIISKYPARSSAETQPLLA